MSNSENDPKAGISLVDGPVENPDISSTSQEEVKLSRAKRWLSSTLSQKNLMALTGLFLCLFLIVHLLGNLQNRRANGKRYEYDRRGVSSKWYSRKMGLLGTVILFFLIIHLRDFWYEVQFGHLPLDKDGQEDLYTLVVTVYRNGWYVLIYVLCMIALGYHLLHGFFSAARTLGVHYPRYVTWIRVIGWIYSVGISAGFALVPVYVHFAVP